MRPLRESCCDSTQSSQTAARPTGIAITFFSVSIQAPGFGSHFTQPGKMVRRSHGSAMPNPSTRNTVTAMAAGCESAKPSAAPMKGAVQGLATMTARIPVKKLPRRPRVGVLSARLPPARLPSVNSNTPARFIVIARKRSARMRTITGF